MFRFPPLTKFVKKTLLTLFVVFVVQLIVDGWLFEGTPLFDMLALRCATPGVHTVWQLFTYVLVASDPMWFIIDCAVFWWVIAPLEEGIGRKLITRIALFSALGAAIPAVLVGAVFPAFMVGPTVLFGTYPIVLGAVAARARMHRRNEMSILGVVPMTGARVLACLVGVSVVIFLFTKSFVGLAADLGALGTGVYFGRQLVRR